MISNYFDIVKEDSDYETIGEARKKYNLEFYHLLKEALNLDLSRSLDIYTYLVNFFIAFNYFPSVKMFMSMISGDSELEKITNKVLLRSYANFERICSIIIKQNLSYSNRRKISSGETDKRLNDILFSKQFISERFFLYNSNPSRLPLKTLIDILDNYPIKDHLLPELIFDPHFQKLAKSKPIRHLFYTSTPLNYLNVGNMEKYQYHLEKDPLETFLKEKDSDKPISKIDPQLNFSSFFDKNTMCDDVLGPFELIDDTIKEFNDYYTQRIDSRKDKIQKILTCFGTLLKLAKGRLFIKIRWSEILEKLEQSISKDDAENFLKRFCMEPQYREFKLEYKDFCPYSYLNEFHIYLKYAGYNHMGLVRTGAFLIWRSLIKYLEELQREREFSQRKGSLLEVWCYNQAVEYGFSPEKLILINPNRNPTDQYLRMKDQIELFPKKPIELPVDFSDLNPNACYREIDMVIKVDNILFIFECKGTSSPIGELGYQFNWVENFKGNLFKLVEKIDLLQYNRALITHPFLKNTNNYCPYIIKTEGIISNYGFMTIFGYIRFLQELRKSIETNSFNKFYEKNAKYHSKEKIEKLLRPI